MPHRNNFLYYFHFADQTTDKDKPRHSDPHWCFETHPDCELPYTQQHCKEFCSKPNYGKDFIFFLKTKLTCELIKLLIT